MLPVPSHIIAPLSVIGLGIVSFFVRWIAELQLEGAGADLALISTSLQLSLIYSRIFQGIGEITVALQSDVFFFIFLLAIWLVSVKFVQMALRSNRRIFGIINPFSTVAFVVGSIALSLEIFWRLQIG